MPRPKFPSDEYRYSLSMPLGMRDQIKEVAKTNHRSMNAEMLYRLEKSFEEQSTTTGSKTPSEQSGEYNHVIE